MKFKFHKTVPAAVVLAALAVTGCEEGNDYDGTNTQQAPPADRPQGSGTSADRANQGSSNANTSDMPSDTGNQPGQATNAGSQQGQLDPQTFVNMAASSGLYEVESSRLALQQATDDQTKQIAQKMVDDHTKANEELKQIAQTKNLTVPSQMMEKHRTQLEALQQAKGTALGSTYHQQQIAAHQEAVSLFERASKQLSDPELKAFAEKTLPTLQEHLKTIQSAEPQPGSAQPDAQPNAQPSDQPDAQPDQPAQPSEPKEPAPADQPAQE